jgi:mono/diheme cytochrome c family protein
VYRFAPRAVHSAATVFCFASLILLLRPAGADTASVASALFTSAQADRGRLLYDEHCMTCHGARLEGNPAAPLAGPVFLGRWADGQHTLDDLFYIIRSQMPYNEPGKLTKQQYADILAYLLQANGYAAGVAELPPGGAALKTITLSPR